MGKRVIFLSGKKVNLRPYNRETDLENCQRWINDPDVRTWIKNVFPITLRQEEEYLEKSTSHDSNNVFLIIETKEGRPIGVISLIKIMWLHRTATTGTIIGEKDCWGQGYATDAKMTLLDYAFNTLNLRKICSTVLAANKRSLAYNKKCGYKEEGVRRKQWFRNGRYIDEIILAVFKEDFMRIWREYKKQK